MSQENVELTRRAFRAFNDRDLDDLLAMLDDDVEAFPILAGMEGGYRGHDGIRRWWTGLLGTFPDFQAEIVELRDHGDSTTAVLRLRGHGAGSDTPVNATAWHVSQFRHGKCTGWRVYTSEREAHTASEQQGGHMYARVATFESDPSKIDDAIALVRGEVESGDTPEGLEGAKMMMLVNREAGTGLGVTLFESEEAMRRGDEALNAMNPGATERRTSVEFYEVPVQTVR